MKEDIFDYCLAKYNYIYTYSRKNFVVENFSVLAVNAKF